MNLNDFNRYAEDFKKPKKSTNDRRLNLDPRGEVNRRFITGMAAQSYNSSPLLAQLRAQQGIVNTTFAVSSTAMPSSLGDDL